MVDRLQERCLPRLCSSHHPSCLLSKEFTVRLPLIQTSSTTTKLNSLTSLQRWHLCSVSLFHETILEWSSHACSSCGQKTATGLNSCMKMLYRCTISPQPAFL